MSEENAALADRLDGIADDIRKGHWSDLDDDDGHTLAALKSAAAALRSFTGTMPTREQIAKVIVAAGLRLTEIVDKPHPDLRDDWVALALADAVLALLADVALGLPRPTTHSG